MHYRDKLLPNQPNLTDHYIGHDPIEGRMFDWTMRLAKVRDIPIESLTASPTVNVEWLSSPPSQVALFSLLISLSRAKKVLEIGTFIGRTTMQLADCVGQDGHVTTIEVGEEFYGYAKENVNRHGYDDRITLLNGNALDLMSKFKDRSFDFIFVDGGKELYLDFALESLRLVTSGGFIIVDDIFFNGDALNDTPQTEKGLGCRKVLDYFLTYDRCLKTLVPQTNGLLVLHGFEDAR